MIHFKQPWVWIVEVKVDGKWVPTFYNSAHRKDGRIFLREAKESNPGEKLRLSKYTSSRDCDTMTQRSKNGRIQENGNKAKAVGGRAKDRKRSVASDNFHEFY